MGNLSKIYDLLKTLAFWKIVEAETNSHNKTKCLYFMLILEHCPNFIIAPVSFFFFLQNFLFEIVRIWGVRLISLNETESNK